MSQGSARGVFLDPDPVATGTLSATDAVVAAPAGDGTLRSGASTAGSVVALACPGGDSSWSITLTGTFGGGTVHFEESLDSTNGTDGNWTNVNGRQTGMVNTILAGGVTAAGFFRGNTGAVKYLRVRITGATTPSVAVSMRISSGTGAVFLNASVPAGSNTIGYVKQAGAATSTPTTVAASASSVTVLAANTARRFASVYNDSSSVLYLLLQTGGTASSTVFTIAMAAGSYYEVPEAYTGALIGIWVSATGNARITEIV